MHQGAELPREFDRFLKETLPGLGYDWRRHRRRGVRRKVLARMRTLGIEGFVEYRKRILTDVDELATFRRLLPVNISRFFRDPHMFDTLADELLPRLLAKTGSVKIWSAGAASGEEPYTLAIIADAFFRGSDISITATEIDAECLIRAAAGIYQQGSLKKLPPELIRRYFAKVKGGWLLDENIRARVLFLEHDLLEDKPPSGMDLVLCRNLAYTYFGPELRRSVTKTFYGSIRPGGFLVLGRTEYLPAGSEEFFSTLYPEDKIYSRNEDRLHQARRA